MNNFNYTFKKSSKDFISEEKISEGQKNNSSGRPENKVKQYNTNEWTETKKKLITKKHNKTPIGKRKNIKLKRILFDFDENKNSRNVEKKKNSFMTDIKNKIGTFIKQKIIPESFKISSSKNSNEEPSINMNECLICQQKLNDEEKEDNLLPCMHMICNECYLSHLKEKINNNKIGEITCCQHGCKTKLYDEFIQKKLYLDIELLDKYLYLKKRRQIMLNPNTQLCPFPDCNSYAKKNDKSIFVQCIDNKHKFCFNCLKEWHPDKDCSTQIENKSLDEWIKVHDARRCPKCKILIQKNEGCNHITCFNCKCEFCWLCLSICDYKHFELGRCAGLLYNRTRCCQNKLINFFYQILISFVKGIILGICLPFIKAFLSFYKNSENYYGLKDFINIIYGISSTLISLNYIILFIPSSFSLSFLSLFFWSCQDKIFEFKSLKILDLLIECHMESLSKFFER